MNVPHLLNQVASVGKDSTHRKKGRLLAAVSDLDDVVDDGERT